MATRLDAIVIGTGQAGLPLASRLADAGRTVAVIERKHFGGTCVNAGCVPTKALVASAHVAHMARRAADYGVSVGGAVGVDMAAARARKEKLVQAGRNGIRSWMEGLEGATVLQGSARFEGPRTVRVGDRVLEADRIFINTGARPTIPKLEGIDRVPYLTSTTVMELDRVPEHLIVVGGSYIGLEFAQVFRRFGAEVTVVEMADRLIAREDEEVSARVRQILEAEGIAVRTGAECLSVENEGDRIAIGLGCEAGAPRAVGSHLLLAVGRRPNTDDLGLEAAGIAADEKGYIIVDEQLRTSVPGIWAIGDVNGRGGFTHTSYNDYEIVAANLLDGESRKASDRIPCYGLFIDPPLGRVGMTEREALKTGRRVLVGRLEMSRVGRARERGETLGFMKVLVDDASQTILGAALLGASGDEVVHTLLAVMAAGAPVTAITRTMLIHPTVCEYLPTLLGDLEPLGPG